MTANYWLSLENIPRQKSFACLSLKFGCVVSALILILYSVFALAQCLAALNMLPKSWTSDDVEIMSAYALIITVSISHAITLLMSTFMLVGAIRDKAYLMKPWIFWTTFRIIISVLMFVFWSAISIINSSVDNSLLLYVVEFLGLMIRFYMLMIVTSFYKHLQEDIIEMRRLRNIINSDNMWSYDGELNLEDK